MVDTKKEYILCAAIFYKIEKTYTYQPKNIEKGFVVCGRRHHNILTLVSELDIIKEPKIIGIQGFLTSFDRFVNREEGLKIAFEAGQTDKNEGILFSENLY